MKDLLVYIIFRIFVFIVKILPHKLKYIMGNLFGKIAYYLTKSRRKIARENLLKAFGGELRKSEIESIIKQVYKNLGLILVEFVLLLKIKKNNLNKFVDIDGIEYLDEVYEQNNGVIIYSAHFGNWEWLAALISLMGYPLNAIAQEQHNMYFNNFINKVRESKGINIIPLGVSVRKAYRKLQEGECVYILGDQDARHHGWNIEFFGRSASTFPGAVQLSQKTGAAILPAFLIREEWGSYRLEFKKPHWVNSSSKEEQKLALQKITDIVESQIREYKDQWFWIHKRWKT